LLRVEIVAAIVVAVVGVVGVAEVLLLLRLMYFLLGKFLLELWRVQDEGSRAVEDV
jgi:HJR/Mrr/RecB family endonuclease